MLLLLGYIFVVILDQRVLGVVLGVCGVLEGVWPGTLLYGVRRIIQTVIRLVNRQALLLGELLKFILELFKVLVLLPFLIAMGVLEEICVLVIVVLGERALGLDLVVVWVVLLSLIHI